MDVCPTVLPHHIPEELCKSRAMYRQGKLLRAVKVYTVSKESSHLLIFNVPAINLNRELQLLCGRFGKIKLFECLTGSFDLDDFTDVYHVNYVKTHSARFAKKHLDTRSFYGAFLHVCYAPERETLEETRLKLITRRNEIALRTGRRNRSKMVTPTRFNNPDTGFTMEFSVSDEFKAMSSSETVSYNHESNIDLLKLNSGKRTNSTSLIPNIVLKRMQPKKKETPQKVPRIVFHRQIDESIS